MRYTAFTAKLIWFMRKLICVAALGLASLPIGLYAGPLPAPTEIQSGQAYLLRDSVALRLKSAKYTAARVNIVAASYFPQAEEKLLILLRRLLGKTMTGHFSYKATGHCGPALD